MRKLTAQHWARGLVMPARVVALAVLIGVGVNHVYWAVVQWPLGDMHVYLDAATRLRSGEPLYLAGDVAINSYWYSPWFAVLWVPLTMIPRDIVGVLWSAILLTATIGIVVALRPWRSRTRLALALLVGPPLLAVSAGGNVQSLLVLSLLLGINRRSGPLWIALAASLKWVPILFVLVYVVRREWVRAASTLSMFALLMLPALAMGVMDADVASEAAPSLLGEFLPAYLIGVIGTAACVFLVPRRAQVLSAATAVVVALPRLFVYDVTMIAVGAASEPQDRVD